MLANVHLARSQTFQNLDFEHPVLPFDPLNSRVAATNAVPGWTPYLLGNPQGDVAYNTVSIGGVQVSLEGLGGPIPIVQGNYSVMLQGSLGGLPISAGIGQVGQIPITAQSLMVFGLVGPSDVSFGHDPFPGSHRLEMDLIGSTDNYNIYQADISMFAGQTGELLFTANSTYTDIIDNIIFSSSPVPEPSSTALLALGSLFILSRRSILTIFQHRKNS